MSKRLIGVVCLVIGILVVSLADAKTQQEFGKWKKGENLITGGDFEGLFMAADKINTKQGEMAWSLEDGACCGRGGEYKWELDKKEKHTGDSSLKVIGVKATGTDWHAKVRHESTSMKVGKNYTVAFWAKGEKPRAVNLSVQMQHDPWTFYQGHSWNITEEWAEYTLTFPATADVDRDMWVGFAIAHFVETFWIDDVRFWEGELKDEIRTDPVPRAVDAKSKLATRWASLKAN